MKKEPLAPSEQFEELFRILNSAKKILSDKGYRKI